MVVLPLPGGSFGNRPEYRERGSSGLCRKVVAPSCVRFVVPAGERAREN